MPQRDSSEPVFRRNNGALEIHCKSTPSLPLSGLITTLPHCDAVTFRSYINIYVVKFLHSGFMATTRPWNLPALFSRSRSFSVDSKKQLEIILHVDCNLEGYWSMYQDADLSLSHPIGWMCRDSATDSAVKPLLLFVCVICYHLCCTREIQA